MRTIINKTNRPLKIHLPQGKILHLGPRKEGQVAPHALESAGIKKFVAAGELEVLGDGTLSGSADRDSGKSAADTHGHHPNTAVRRRGDR